MSIDPVFLKPMVDMQVFIVWRVVKQRERTAILPGDTIEVDVGVKLPINTTSLPAELHIQVLKYDLTKFTYVTELDKVENITVPQPCTVWRNMTLVVP